MTFYKITNDDELYHYGRLGMKWYQHIYTSAKDYLAARARKFKTTRAAKKAKKSEIKRIKILRKKDPRKMTDAELKEHVNRLTLEKTYTSLMKDVNEGTKSRGKKWLEDRIERISANAVDNIFTQLAAYGMGTAVNKIAKQNIVDPKNIQKKK